MAQASSPKVVLTELMACLIAAAACAGAGGDAGIESGHSTCEVAGGVCLAAGATAPPNYQPAPASLACGDPSLACWQPLGVGSSRSIGCIVEGQRYADGATVPDPYSCNTCRCEDGEVGTCTEIACPEACPEGTSPGASCAACGPADACTLVETGCLRECQNEDDCTDSPYFSCIDGQCRNVCG